MQEMTATEAKNNFGALMDMALKEPVKVKRNGREAVVMIPAHAYKEYEYQKKENSRKFIETMQRIGKNARKRGLTDKIAQEILDELS